MTSKLFCYIAHQRKYPLYGVSRSAVHRANRSINVRPVMEDGMLLMNIHTCNTVSISDATDKKKFLRTFFTDIFET